MLHLLRRMQLKILLTDHFFFLIILFQILILDHIEQHGLLGQERQLQRRLHILSQVEVA